MDQLQCDIHRYSKGMSRVRWPSLGGTGHDIWFTCTLRHTAGLFNITSFLRVTPATTMSAHQPDFLSWLTIGVKEQISASGMVQTNEFILYCGRTYKYSIHFNIYSCVYDFIQVCLAVVQPKICLCTSPLLYCPYLPHTLPVACLYVAVMVLMTRSPSVRVGLQEERTLHCQFAVDHKAPHLTVEWYLQRHGGYRTNLFSYSSSSGQTEGSGVAGKGIARGDASLTVPVTSVSSEGT